MQEIVDDIARYLGASIGGLHNILDRVVIGGGVSRAGASFISPQVVASALGDDSVLWGAAQLAKGIAGRVTNR
jgi:predicted NBD/HSP70 family sugar kinase